MGRALLFHNQDNVAVALEDLAGGSDIPVAGAAPQLSVRALQDILFGHKVAVRDIADGNLIIKYGVPVGVATREIRTGEWVHIHNVRSSFVEQSSYLHQGDAGK